MLIIKAYAQGGSGNGKGNGNSNNEGNRKPVINENV